MPAPAQVATTSIKKPVIGKRNYQGFNPRSEILPKGWNGYNSRPLPVDILVEHDVGFKVRDGCTLYADIYRPPSSGLNKKVPAIVAWSPFGKKANGNLVMDLITWNVGIAKGVLSGLERFEGPDPAEYVPRGYAVINVDARGSGDSDGSVVIMGSQEGEDGYDVIEGIARKDWCSGSIGLAGNSHLGIVQWHIASQNPPSLKAIAPWEAAGDLYREQFVRGGVWDSGLFDCVIENNIQGGNGVEYLQEMYRRSPLQNAYWEDKRAKINEIDIPTYIVASYSTFVHTMGSIRGWRDVNTKDKWLRWDPYQEWYDLWCVKESRDELGDFFDKFLKGEDNGFEKTPRVRLSLLRFGDNEPVEAFEVEDYPLLNTRYRDLFLNKNKTLSLESPSEPSTLTYFSEVKDAGFEKLKFEYKFTEKIRLAGMLKAVMHMSTPDHNDMNIYVVLRKLDKNGKPLLNLKIPWKAAPINSFSELQPKDHHNLLHYHGPMGVLKASHRHFDQSKSIHPNYPFHTHDRLEKLEKNQIVELHIGLWAVGIEHEAGEGISLEVQGQYPLFKDYTAEERPDPIPEEKNHGRHTLHLGGEYPSRINLPFT